MEDEAIEKEIVDITVEKDENTSHSEEDMPPRRQSRKSSRETSSYSKSNSSSKTVPKSSTQSSPIATPAQTSLRSKRVPTSAGNTPPGSPSTPSSPLSSSRTFVPTGMRKDRSTSESSGATNTGNSVSGSGTTTPVGSTTPILSSMRLHAKTGTLEMIGDEDEGSDGKGEKKEEPRQGPPVVPVPLGVSKNFKALAYREGVIELRFGVTYVQDGLAHKESLQTAS